MYCVATDRAAVFAHWQATPAIVTTTARNACQSINLLVGHWTLKQPNPATKGLPRPLRAVACRISARGRVGKRTSTQRRGLALGPIGYPATMLASPVQHDVHPRSSLMQCNPLRARVVREVHTTNFFCPQGHPWPLRSPFSKLTHRTWSH